jgi:hypothetical protein
VINAPVSPEPPIEVVVNEDSRSFSTTKRKSESPNKNSLQREFHDHSTLLLYLDHSLPTNVGHALIEIRTNAIKKSF